MKLRNCEYCKLSAIGCNLQKGCNPFCRDINCDKRISCSSGVETIGSALERYLDCENEKTPVENWILKSFLPYPGSRFYVYIKEYDVYVKVTRDNYNIISKRFHKEIGGIVNMKKSSSTILFHFYVALGWLEPWLRKLGLNSDFTCLKANQLYAIIKNTPGLVLVPGESDIVDCTIYNDYIE